MVIAKQSGFTLIELVVVIVILGILAAVAVPKFVDLSSEATTAKNAAVAGSTSMDNNIQFSKCIAQGGTAGGCGAQF